jgi:hypothetical protein
MEHMTTFVLFLNVGGRMEKLGLESEAEEWRLLVHSYETTLKVGFLNNDNIWP